MLIKCSRCKKDKDPNDFFKRKRNKTGRRSQCKSCEAEAKKKAYGKLDVIKKASLLYKAKERRDLLKFNALRNIPRIDLIRKFARVNQPIEDPKQYNEDSLSYFEKINEYTFSHYFDFDFDVTKEIDLFRNNFTKINDLK